MSSGRFDIVVLERLTIRCISETGWFDAGEVFGDIRDAGGADADQYAIPWPPFGALHEENAAGFSALVEAQMSDGRVRRVLFDTGWNPAWMDRRFAEEGVDRLLQQGQIEALVISHEHFDHFWGIGSTLKHCPGLTIYLPPGFHADGLALIRDQGHRGTLVTAPLDQPLRLFPGLALAYFPTPALLQVEGEIVLYAHLKNRGLTLITGCGHGGVLNLLEYARQKVQGGERIHALYGGLHIAPLEDWDAQRDQLIHNLQAYGLEKIACNHCTGQIAVKNMLAAGLPVLGGSVRHGSQTALFIGNGDRLELG